jgi:flagellar biosynthesis/type III secretory pathway chaperone
MQSIESSGTTDPKDKSEMETLQGYFQDLLDILEQERAALTAHDGSALDACVARKNDLCQQLAQALQASPEISARISANNADVDTHPASLQEASPAPPELDVDHKILLELAAKARDSNLVNGKILHRSQQSVREILGILSGKSLDGLYGQSGQQTAVPEPGSNAIARA